jgi:hypothetical protein
MPMAATGKPSQRAKHEAPLPRTPAEIAEDRTAAVKRLCKEHLLPDTELAPLTSFCPAVLLARRDEAKDVRKVKRLTLALALIYNDLKALNWVLTQHSYGPIPSGTRPPDAYAGQWTGMGDYFVRLISAHLHELTNVLDKGDTVIRSIPFQAGLARVKNGKARRAWDLLLETSSGRGADPASLFFRYARNKAAFHYGHRWPERHRSLAKGWARWCTTYEMDAFVSLGESWERSRFFFADAAVQSLVLHGQQRYGVTAADTSAVVSSVNFALRFVVEALIEHLAAIQGFPPPKPYSPQRGKGDGGLSSKCWAARIHKVLSGWLKALLPSDSSRISRTP